MIRIVSSRILVLIVVSLVLTGIPKLASAQRGGHGGGGGFHGGGSGFHGGGSFGGFRGGAGGFHGGGGYGGFYGRGYGGFYGRGYGGFYGRGYGFPGYGYGFGFGFGPYWGYPYYYGYGPWGSPYAYYYPYDYYYPDDRDYPPDNRYPRDNRDGCDYRHEDDHPCKPNNENAPAKPSSRAVPESSPEHNYVTRNPADDGSAFSLVDYRSTASTNPGAVTAPVASNYQLRDSATRPLPSGLRPGVRNVIQALRAMPPDARQRQLNSGRYRSFSPEERELLINATETVP